MNQELRLSRRACLVALGALCVDLAPGWLGLADREGHPSAPDERTRLLATLQVPASAVVVGREILRRQPRELTPERLLAELEATGVSGGGDVELATALRARVHTDFATGQTLQVHGWLLSRTEARLCALAALS